jgi:hypothetical protein
MTENDATTGNFADQTVTNQTRVYGAVFKTTTELKTSANYSDAGYDLTVIWNIDGSTNQGYAFLRANPEYTWTGAGGSQWATVSNWTGTSLPTYGARVIIPDVTNDPVIGNGTNATCNYLNIASNATLTIRDGGALTASGPTSISGALIIESGGSFIDNTVINNNGTFSVERNISDDTWHLIAVPNNNTTANTFLGDYLQYWSEVDQSWTDIINPSTAIIPMHGYALWHDSKADYTFTGTPNTGLHSFILSYHDNAGGGSDGINLVGNPYPSSIDWALLQPTYGTAYVWNPGTTNYIYNTDADIAPMQGFFIYTTNNESSFTLQNSHRSHGGTFYKEGKVVSNGLILAATYGNFKDEWILNFDETAGEGFSLTDDSWKLISDYEGVSQLWSESPDGKLAIDKRPETETIQLGFANNKTGNYSIALKEMADISTVMLEDTKTGTFHNLQSGAYQFSWDPFMDDENRFKLHLNAVGIEETPISQSNIVIYATDNQIFIKGMEKGEVIVSDIMGRVILQDELSGDGSIRLTDNLQTGIYMVTAQSGKEIKTEKVFFK